MFEITFDIPILWLLLGLSMVYITAALSKKIVYLQFQQKYYGNEHDPDVNKINFFSPFLIVQSFIFIKRNIPNFRDRNSKCDDEAASFLLLI
ncbi:hypothetical protein BTR23_15260 [Alkalihalophilus pseudofirmus]|uniref:hypothetical protein n=1 Tax=Alkalihalobacterium alkalinitrilicum TaxID=427920 RepID=UPI00094DE329|nr:hypothetical protein [Alkalihalobacterium alkalinitrilicum]OLO36426.1 hypothetical protein BTR23_15260 [Alkalihalophilus pseudofirmus]